MDSSFHLKRLAEWAANPKVVGFPQPQGLPRFGVKRFRTHAEFDAWKQEYLAEIARNGGVRWSKPSKS